MACVTAAGERSVESLSQRDPTALSRHGGHKPYSKWTMHKYLQEDEDARRGFWSKAPADKKVELARALTEKFREQDDQYQEARAMGAEPWGLGGGPVAGAATQDVSQVEQKNGGADEEEVY